MQPFALKLINVKSHRAFSNALTGENWTLTCTHIQKLKTMTKGRENHISLFDLSMKKAESTFRRKV